MARNVYVLSSFHHAGDVGLNLIHGMDDTLEVRLGLSKQIIMTDKNNISFFSDSIDPYLARSLERTVDFLVDICKKVTNVDEVANVLDQLFRETFPGQKTNVVSHFDEVKLLALLRFMGYDVHFKRTESARHEKLSVTERDKKIYQNIKEYGTGTNILYIGSAHKLIDLRDSPDLDHYRIEIRSSQGKIVRTAWDRYKRKEYEMGKMIEFLKMVKEGTLGAPIKVTGKMPQRYQEGFEAFKREFEGRRPSPLTMKVRYV